MKLHFFISSLSGGGAEKVLTTLAREFSAAGDSVYVISLEKKEQFYPVAPSIKLTKLNFSKCGKFRAFLKELISIRKILKNGHADMNISFLSRCNLYVLAASFLLKEKVIVCDRNNPLKEHSWLFFWLSCQIYRRAQGIIVQTEKIKTLYPGYLQKKIYVIENPLDEKALEKQISGRVPDPENAIISIGRLEPQKDYETLIGAFSKIAGSNKDWKLKIYGKGKLEKDLRELIRLNGLDGRVLLCGSTKQPFREMKNSKIFVLSSKYEGFPNVLCEGMYAGLPCISSDCISGPSELIRSGENGILFPVGDKTDLAEKLELLIKNEELRSRMGQNAKNTVKRLSLPIIFRRWKKVIEELANS